MSVLIGRAAPALLLVSLLAMPGCEDKKSEGPPSSASASAKTTSAASSTGPAATASASSGKPAVEATIDSVCAALAKARCAKLESCNKVTFALHEGTSESCLARTKNVCLHERASKESGISIPALEKCAKAQEAASCSEALAGHLPDCKREPGKIADGKGCAFDSQCASQFCTRGPGESCGKCETAPKEGEACKLDRCGHGGLACVDAKCVKRGSKGDACKAHRGCLADLVCFGGKCSAPAKAGEKCDPTGKAALDCDSDEGLECDKTKTCKVYTVSMAGDECGEKFPDKSCRADSTCEDGKCVALLPIGATCDAKKGAMCDAPATCIGGTCKIPDVASCN